MCNDFTLCPACFAEDTLTLRQHIFLKLKFQQRRELPLGPVLKPQVISIVGMLMSWFFSYELLEYIKCKDYILCIGYSISGIWSS